MNNIKNKNQSVIEHNQMATSLFLLKESSKDLKQYVKDLDGKVNVITVDIKYINHRLTDFRTDMSDLKKELKSDISNLRQELKSDISNLEQKLVKICQILSNK